MRAPVVAGVGGGVGTTTVAVALRGHDAGGFAGRWPDILVCRGTLDSLRRATAVLDTAGRDAFPVLAVTFDAARAARRPIRARLDLLEPDLGALVLLPYVRRWATLADPLADAAHLLAEPADRLPRPLRAYAAALRELVEAVTASGHLDATPDERHARPSGSDERHIRLPGSGDRRIHPVGSEQQHAHRTGSDERIVRRTGREGRPTHRASDATVGRPGLVPVWAAAPAVPQASGGTVGRPDPTPVGTAVPRRPTGVRIVRPDVLPTAGVPHRHAPATGIAAERIDQAERTDRVERNRVRQAEQSQRTDESDRVQRSDRVERTDRAERVQRTERVG